jgi:ParB-like chromosome segregation protein Spo0J
MLQIIERDIEDLIPYALNSRTHDDNQVLQIASSIREFGFTNPVLIDDESGIIAGHGRLLAAKKLELEKIPCIVLSGLTESQKKAYVIADNKIALGADWDLEILQAEVDTLRELDYDVLLTGFSDEDQKSFIILMLMTYQN